MTRISSAFALLSLVLAATLTGCPAASEPPQETSLKPNVSKSPVATDPALVDTATSDVAPDATEPVANTPPKAMPAQTSGSQSVAATPDDSATDALAPPSNSPSNPPQQAAPQGGLLTDAVPEYQTPVWEPSVVMSQAHTDTCKVRVGDKFPALTAQTLAGDAATTDQMLGEAFANVSRLAVVLFWESDDIHGAEQYSRLQSEIVDPYAEYGMQVVAIHEGGTAADVEQVAAPAESLLANLIDPDGTALEKVATDKLPRTYLLDSQGNVLWHDLQYSSGTRRDLRNAIRYHLTQQTDSAE